MINPDKYIRKACLALFFDFSIPIYDRRLPKDLEIPTSYIIFETQTKKQQNTSKCGHDWNCSILFDVVTQAEVGYADSAVVDDIEEKISNKLDLQNGDINVDGFKVYNTQLIDSHDIVLDTKTKTIIRKLLRYQFILSGEY